MRNIRMEIARALFQKARKQIKDPTLRAYMDEGLDQLSMATHIYEQRIEEAKMIGVRNPAFDCDMVGWLDDDFDYDDKDDDKK